MRTRWWPLTSVVFALAVMGCGRTGSAPVAADKKVDKKQDHHEHEKETANKKGSHDHEKETANKKDSHDHSGWWCDEHGVPEDVCALCNSKVAAEFQKKGDWCKMHDRPDSQCFKCHPELEAKFAAQYQAKYGKQPPKPEG